jgi:hypothetical protein
MKIPSGDGFVIGFSSTSFKVHEGIEVDYLAQQKFEIYDIGLTKAINMNPTRFTLSQFL